MFLRIESSSFLKRSSFWCNLKILKSHIGSDPLKGVNQGVPPPEKWFFENPVHVYEDRDFWFFAKFINCGIFYHIKSQLGCDPLKGVNQGVPPLKTGFLRILAMFLKIETSSFLQCTSIR